MSQPVIHFISGLPRSGSTLLAALLRQNPRFHAAMTSALVPLIRANLEVMSAGSEASLLIQSEQRTELLRAIVDVFCRTSTDRDVYFDTNRSWCAKMPLIEDLFSRAKVIACVRDVSWIMDSIERLFRGNPYENTRLFTNERERSTVYTRVESLAQPNRLVGYPWTALKEAFYGEQAEKLLIVDYETLARSPEKALKLIYTFLDEPWFEGHDFDNVEYDAPDFDQALGITGLHKVRPKVAFEARKTLLPPDVFHKFENMDFWKDCNGSGANVIMPRKVRK